jgi:putative hydrolase of the HAD superfamily
MKDKAKLKAILFDMGSTLIEFENSTWDILGRICAERGFRFLKENDLNLPDFKQFVKLLDVEYMRAYEEVKDSLREFKFEQVAGDFFKALNISTSDGLYEPFMERYYQPISDQLTSIDDAEEVLKYFKKKGVKIGLVSNTIFPQRFHLKELKKFGLFSYLDRYHFSSEVGVRKPHPDIFLKTLSDLDTAPQHAVFVGDRLVEDVGGAQKVGMKGILKYLKRRDHSAPITPDAKIDQLKELPQTVSSLFDI